jgi:xylitol oxidase
MAERIAPILHMGEVRTMAADDLWLSGACGRPTVGIHFTWHKDPRALALLPELDELFGAHGGRAHWGKLHATPPSEYPNRYPRLDDFRRLRQEFDPRGKFTNDHLSWL